MSDSWYIIVNIWHYIDDIKKHHKKTTKKTPKNNRLKNTQKKLSWQSFLHLQYVAFVSIFCQECYY